MKRLGLTSVILASMLSTGAFAQDSPPASEPPTEASQVDPASLPTADEIFEKHIEAIGGREAIFAQTSRRISGVYEGPPFAFPVRLTLWQDAPDRFHLRLAEPAGATMDIGYDGQTGWRQVSGSNAAEMTGQDLAELRQTADFFGESNYKQRYTTRQTVGAATLAGRSVYVVGVVTPDKRDMYVMFDMETGLFTGTRTKFVDPAGATREMISIVSEYEDAGGVLYPRRIEQLIGGLEERITYVYRKVEVDAEPDGHVYTMPTTD